MKFEDDRLRRANIIRVCVGKMITAEIENKDLAPGKGIVSATIEFQK